VLALKTPEAKTDFIQSIYDKDQEFRGRHTIESLDFRNLVSISYFLNEYGYPISQEYGRASKAPWLIWVHNSYPSFKKITFPLIFRAFLREEISEGDLRTYHLKNLYRDKFDDEGNRTLPLDELFLLCEVSTEPKISLKELIAAKEKIEREKIVKISRISYWQSENSEKVIERGGKKYLTGSSGQRVQLVKKENGKWYLRRPSVDNSHYEKQLEEIAPNKFKYKGKQTDKYFEVLKDRMQYRNSLEVFKEYFISGSDKEADPLQQQKHNRK